MAYEDGTGGVALATGIRLRVTGAAGFLTVIERSLTSGSGFVEIAVLGTSTGAAEDYTDPLPLDGVTRYYRARSRRDRNTDSAATSEVSGIPKRLT
jgi:hypothetical protein